MRHDKSVINAVILAKKNGLKHREIARAFLGSPSKASTVWGILNKYYYNKPEEKEEDVEVNVVKKAKILILDIETSPELVWTFSRWKTNISPAQVVIGNKVLTIAAKWLGEDEVKTSVSYVEPNYMINDYETIKYTWNLLNEADIVVAHNGDKFDIPMLNSRFLSMGFSLPKPFKTVDTFKLAKRMFKLQAYSLAELARYLGVSGKDKMEFGDWIGFMEGDVKAINKMIKYNIQDVKMLEDIYLMLSPYDTKHPNVGLITDNKDACPVCGSFDVVETDGKAITSASVFKSYVCKNCGHRVRGIKRSHERSSFRSV